MTKCHAGTPKTQSSHVPASGHKHQPTTYLTCTHHRCSKTFTLQFDHMCNLHGQSITATKNGSDNRTWSDNQSKGRRSTLILFLTTAHQATSICPPDGEPSLMASSLQDTPQPPHVQHIAPPLCSTYIPIYIAVHFL